MTASALRFRPATVFTERDQYESGFTCCAFSALERFLLLGNCSGHLVFYNVISGEQEAKYTCHATPITHLQPSGVSASPLDPASRLRLKSVWLIWCLCFRMESWCSLQPPGGLLCRRCGAQKASLRGSRRTPALFASTC